MAKIHSLGYLGVESPRAAEWPAFATDIFGVPSSTEDDGTVRLRIDDRTYRIRIFPGSEDRLRYLGWETSNVLEYTGFIAHLRDRGVEVTEESAEVARDREVRAVASFTDPFGLRQELFYGPAYDDRSFQGGRATTSFITGSQGLGHAVIVVPDFDLASEFYEHTLGFKCSDIVNVGFGPMAFLRCNPRHHSIAIWHVPGSLGLQHVMIESTNVNDVGRAYDLVQKSPHKVSASLGRHAGDEQISFYTRTPSGFDLEFGSDSLSIHDDDAWSMRLIDKSFGVHSELWGHQFTPLPPQSSIHAYAPDGVQR